MPADPILRDRARRLRRERTDAERTLWQRLRGKQLGGLKFRRQHVVGPWILDFYCPECRLAVELDGGQHNEAENRCRDEARTAFLEDRGMAMLRYSNLEALRETDAVLEDIARHAAGRRLAAPRRRSACESRQRPGRAAKPSPNPSRPAGGEKRKEPPPAAISPLPACGERMGEGAGRQAGGRSPATVGTIREALPPACYRSVHRLRGWRRRARRVSRSRPWRFRKRCTVVAWNSRPSAASASRSLYMESPGRASRMRRMRSRSGSIPEMLPPFLSDRTWPRSR
ncbi:MAG: DUF559 domain-containing protein [Alphaproteobacteria bacterium]|nr:DUF559 domain-containing protein [Alphaproteobacteria bacterium]